MRRELAVLCVLVGVWAPGFARAGAVAKPSTPKPSTAKSTPAQPAEPPPPEEPKPPLLGFCAVPVKPDCVDTPASYANPKARAACVRDMDHYVKYVFAYRLCLNAEMERAVRQTNETIEKHKCRMSGGKKC